MFVQIFWLCLVTTLSPAEEQLRIRALEANRENRSRIQTLDLIFHESNVEVPISTDGTVETKVHWLQTGEIFRYDLATTTTSRRSKEIEKREQKSSKSTENYLKYDEYTKKDGIYRSATINYSSVETEASLANPWSRGLFNLSENPTKTVLDYLADPTNITSLSMNPQKTRIELSYIAYPMKIVSTVSIDVTHNYVVDKVTTVNPKNGNRQESIVESFAEPQPGIFFPEKIYHTTYLKGKLLVKSLVTFDKIQINTNVDQSQIALKIPDGTIVDDLTDGTRYVSKAGKPDERGREPLQLIDLNDPTALLFPKQKSDVNGNFSFGKTALWLGLVMLPIVAIVLALKWTKKG